MSSEQTIETKRQNYVANVRLLGVWISVNLAQRINTQTPQLRSTRGSVSRLHEQSGDGRFHCALHCGWQLHLSQETTILQRMARELQRAATLKGAKVVAACMKRKVVA